MSTVPRSRRHAIVPEHRRFLIASGIALLIGGLVAALIVGTARTASEVGAALAVGGLAFLDVWCLVYVLATLRAFAKTPADVLRKLVAGHTNSLWARILRGGSYGPSLAILFASVALVAAAVLPRVDQLAPTGPLHIALLVLAVSAVVLCWTVLAVGYAVHYVRLDVHDHGLQFPGDQAPQFADYLYFAISVATTFGTTDVDVINLVMRRSVIVQAVLAFVFNTVILALVLAVLS